MPVRRPARVQTAAAPPPRTAPRRTPTRSSPRGRSTVGTGNPAFPPWWSGGEVDGSEFEFNDPSLGEGYEGAVVAEVTDRLGLTFPDQVTFVPLGFNKSFAPGDKDFDFVLQQISYAPERDEAVDFSESYYDVNQALVSTQGLSDRGGHHDRRT